LPRPEPILPVAPTGTNAWNAHDASRVRAFTGRILVNEIVALDNVASSNTAGRAARDVLSAGVVLSATDQEVTAMQQFFDQFLRFLQQGIAAIFRFVELIWSWSVTQISSLTRVPWQDWPLWKQLFLVLIMAGVVYALYKVAVELWQAGERILAAFATLLGVLVRTLPSVMIAGLVALGGLWVLNNVDFSNVRLPAFLQTTSLDRQ